MQALGDGLWAPVAVDQIEALFQPLFAAAGRPAEMAIFIRRDAGELHCEVTAYFAPAAGGVARAAGALPCDRPRRAGLELAMGDAQCWAVLFVED